MKNKKRIEILQEHNEKNKKYYGMKKERNKGITLIALTVTIIVILILSGVSITVVFGEKRNY